MNITKPEATPNNTRTINATDLQHPVTEMLFPFCPDATPEDRYTIAELLEEEIEEWIEDRVKVVGLARNLRPHPDHRSHTHAALKSLKQALYNYLQTLVVDVEYTSD